ncbi:hypothetical protein V6N13_080624 [Hibiscus sabdariffa]
MIERLNNFHLFGSKITVSVARHQPRKSYWRRVHSGTGSDTHREGNTGNEGVKGSSRRPDAVLKENVEEKPKHDEVRRYEKKESSRSRIYGHIETEALWKLKNCLIGEMATVCSIESIRNRLHEWGLDDVKIRRFGGRSFIITIEDMEFYKMLEDLQWSYLKEILSSVRPWSEAESSLYKTTWIEITGVPLHCWNGTTFRRLAQLWGDFEAFGENLNCSVDCEKMKVFISTKQDQKIWDVVELEVGSLVCNVRIVEVGFMDNSSKKTDTRSGGSPWKEKGRNSPTVSSSSESQSPMTGGTKRFQDVEVAINADDGGTHSNHDEEAIDSGKTRCQENRGEVGEDVETLAADSINLKQLNEGLKGVNQSKPIVNWAEFLFKNKEALEEAVEG